MLESTFVELQSPNGGIVGSLVIPDGLTNQLETTLYITIVTNVPRNLSGQDFGAGTILNIVLVNNANGELITELEAPLTICFAANKTKGNQCLGYFDEKKSKWKCEDKCLLRSKKDKSLCGQTSHLTNFALLLRSTGGGGGGAEGDDPCGSPPSLTLTWVSMGLIGGAIIIIGLAVVVIEVIYRRQAFIKKKNMDVVVIVEAYGSLFR